MDRFAILTAGTIRPYYDTLVKITEYQWKNDNFKQQWASFNPALYEYINDNLKHQSSVEVKIPGLNKDEVLKKVFANLKYIDYEKELTPPFKVSSNEYEDECKDAQTGYLTEYEVIKLVLGEDVLSTHDQLHVYTLVTQRPALLKKYAMDNKIVVGFNKNTVIAELNEALKIAENEYDTKLNAETEYINNNIADNEEDYERIEERSNELRKETEASKQKVLGIKAKIAKEKETFSLLEIETNLLKRFNSFYRSDIEGGANLVKDIQKIWKKGVPYFFPRHHDPESKQDLNLDKLNLFQENYKKYLLKEQEIARYTRELERYTQEKRRLQVDVISSKQKVRNYLLNEYMSIPQYGVYVEIRVEEKAGSLFNQKRIKV